MPDFIDICGRQRQKFHRDLKMCDQDSPQKASIENRPWDMICGIHIVDQMYVEDFEQIDAWKSSSWWETNKLQKGRKWEL